MTDTNQEVRETPATVEFAKWAIRESAFSGCDLSGGDVQEKAAELGLLTETVYDPEKHGPSDFSEPGMPWFEFSAALASAPPPAVPDAVGVRDAQIKTLEWETVGEALVARTPIGACEVIAFPPFGKDDLVVRLRGFDGEKEWFRSADEAKAAAQADFDRRILSSIEPTPSPEPQAAEALAAMERRKDAAYEERNKVVAALAKLFPSGTCKTDIPGWSEDWHGCVRIDLPTGQVSWHYHDSQAHLFADLPPYQGEWDGHDTAEKYRRLAALSPEPQASNAGAAIREVLEACNLYLSKHGYQEREGTRELLARGELCGRVRSALAALSTPEPQTGERDGEALEAYYDRQIEWSRKTFGPALRTGGVIDHIRKELCEIEADPHDLSEWVDVIILAMDGFWRHGGAATDLMPALLAKQVKNMARDWPDWRTMSENVAIEHDRSGEPAALSTPEPQTGERDTVPYSAGFEAGGRIERERGDALEELLKDERTAREAAERERDKALRKADVNAESFEFWHREAKEQTRRTEAAEASNLRNFEQSQRNAARISELEAIVVMQQTGSAEALTAERERTERATRLQLENEQRYQAAERRLAEVEERAWRKIVEADREIATVQTFGGVVLRNSHPAWVRDEDGRTYEAVWTVDDKGRGYWWDIEGESPVDPVMIYPHPRAALRAKPEAHTLVKKESDQ